MADFYSQSVGLSPSIGDYAKSVVPQDAAIPASEPPSLDQQIEEQTKRAKLRQLQLLEGFPAAMAADSATARANQGMQAGYAAQNANAYRGLASTPMPDIKKPQYQPLPTPPKAEYREPWQALGSPLAALAMIAGAFTRNSGTATLKTAAAAMNAQRQGDMQGYKDARENFMDNFNRTLQANQMEHQQYKDAWEDSKLTWDAKVARINALATANQNSAVAGAARGGKVDELGKLIAANGKSIEILESLKPGFGEKPEQQAWDAANKEAKRVATAEGRGSDEGHVAELRAELYTKYEPKKVPAGGAKTGTEAQYINTRVPELLAEGKPASEAQRLAHEEWRNRPLTKAQELVDSAAKIQQEAKEKGEPVPSHEEAMQQAIVNRNQPGGKAWAKMQPGLQQTIRAIGQNTPGLVEKIQKSQSELPQVEQRQLQRAKQSIDGAEDIANYIVAKPWSVGLAAELAKKIPGMDLTKSYTAEEAFSRMENAQGAFDGQERELAARYKVKPSQISDAIVLYKKFIQQSLDDAASTGRATVFMERLLLGGVYKSDVQPGTILRITQDRAKVAEEKWKNLLDDQISFKNHPDDQKYKLMKTGWQDFARGANVNFYENANDESLGRLLKEKTIDRPTQIAIKLERKMKNVPNATSALQEISQDTNQPADIRDGARLLLKYRYQTQAVQ